jgi:hypothetical protein
MSDFWFTFDNGLVWFVSPVDFYSLVPYNFISYTIISWRNSVGWQAFCRNNVGRNDARNFIFGNTNRFPAGSGEAAATSSHRTDIWKWLLLRWANNTITRETIPINLLWNRHDIWVTQISPPSSFFYLKCLNLLRNLILRLN